MSSSRIKPVMREIRVNKETMEADLNKLTAQSVAVAMALNAAHPRLLLESQALLTTSTDPKELNNGIYQTQEKEPTPGVGP
jgi:hypothetical protein